MRLIAAHRAALHFRVLDVFDMQLFECSVDNVEVLPQNQTSLHAAILFLKTDSYATSLTPCTTALSYSIPKNDAAPDSIPFFQVAPSLFAPVYKQAFHSPSKCN